MQPVISITGLSKTYASGFAALKGVDLDIMRGEIIALLGPNGAGKTTLIGIVCGMVSPTSGRVVVDGHDIATDFRKARQQIGLVPQETSIDIFATVRETVSYSRGLFGRSPDPAHIERVLRQLTLWDKRNDRIITLSGGMKRRTVIAKALAHEPTILFLDEPTAGVDVELRQDMWRLVRGLRDAGVTIILTTHYIAEAEEMADRIGIINKGELMLVEEKAELMRKLGRKRLILQLPEKVDRLPEGLEAHKLELAEGGRQVVFTYDTRSGRTGITALLGDLRKSGVAFTDIETNQSSLEEIFVDLVGERA